jgi:rhodanese-related sulfurtransferase
MTGMNAFFRWLRRASPATPWIDAPALATRLGADDPLVVLDVRGPDEFTGPLGHIAGAVNVPLNELPTHLADLTRRGRPIVVVCKTDRRSSTAVQQLRAAGLARVSVLRGGMEGWQALDLPVA